MQKSIVALLVIAFIIGVAGVAWFVITGMQTSSTALIIISANLISIFLALTTLKSRSKLNEKTQRMLKFHIVATLPSIFILAGYFIGAVTIWANFEQSSELPYRIFLVGVLLFGGGNLWFYKTMRQAFKEIRSG